MIRKFIISTILASAALATMLPTARADEVVSSFDSKLLIVNGNTDRIIYDNGRDDYLCVYRRHFIGYNGYGHVVRRSTIRCR